MTPHWRDRYNGLIGEFAKRFNPPLSKNDGITVDKNGLIWANHAARVHMFTMNTWKTSAMHVPASQLPK